MKTVTATEARARLYRLLEEASELNEPIQIIGNRGNAVLVGESYWRSIQETLYLLSISGMRESILEGGNEPVEECAEDRLWTHSE
jgi:antitoxin YefM